MIEFTYNELALIYQAADKMAKQAIENLDDELATEYEVIAFKIRPMADERFPFVDPLELKYGEK